MTGERPLYSEEYTRYQAQRSRLRRMIRHCYLRKTLRWCIGKTIDFGCGTGVFLQLLPPGSIGFEVNEASVRYCQGLGLDVRHYDPRADAYRLEDCEPGTYSTLILSHVLEHLDDAAEKLRTIFGSCKRLGIRRVVVLVPGPKGYRFDATHRTFVDRAYLRANGLLDQKGARIVKESFYPIPWAWGGTIFTHNEWMIVYDLVPREETGTAGWAQPRVEDQ